MRGLYAEPYSGERSSVRDVLVCPIAYSLQFGKQTVKRSLMRRRGFEPFIRFVPEAFSAAAAALGSGRDREQTAEQGTLEQSVKDREQNGVVEGSDIDEEGQHREDRK